MKKTLITFLTLISLNSFAGLYDTAGFIEAGSVSIGGEVDTGFTKEYGSFLNLKVKEGITDLLNLEQTVGIGTNERKYRIGANAILDVFPDVENQPGFGISLGADFYKRDLNSLLIFSATPYVHKKLKLQNVQTNPFIGFNSGVELLTNSNTYVVPVSIAAGIQFYPLDKENIAVVAEVGVPITTYAYTTLSAGVLYKF